MNKCPENTEFDFVFEGKCPITSCQHCTSATENGCMFLDRKDSADKGITNKEIKHYKQGLFPEFSEFDQKALDAYVRQAQSRARSAICLQLYIDSLAESGKEQFSYKPRFTLVHNVHNYLKQTFDRYEDWMIFYMGNEEAFSEITGTVSSLDITLGQALGRMTPKKFEAFRQALEMLLTVDEAEDATD